MTEDDQQCHDSGQPPQAEAQQISEGSFFVVYAAQKMMTMMMIIMIMMRLMMTRSHFSVGVVLTKHGACLEKRGSRGLVTVDTEGHQEYFANM